MPIVRLPINTKVAGKADVGLANVDNTPDSLKPVSAAQAVAIAAANGAVVETPASYIIPLDTAGNGRKMAEQACNSNIAFTFSAPVEGGNCVFSVIGNGTNVATFAGFLLQNGYAFNSALGARNIYSAAYLYGSPMLYGAAGTFGAAIPAPAPPPPPAPPSAPAFSAQTAPTATVGVAYSYTYAASYTISFAVSAGALPAGITLNTSTGVISGTPTTAATSAFTISATGSGGTTASTAQSVVVSAAAPAPVPPPPAPPPAPVFSAQSAPAGTVGVLYSYTYAAANTTSFSVASGTLPAGVTLNASNGVISGTPTTAATAAFTISATGSGGTTASTAQSVVVAAAPVDTRPRYGLGAGGGTSPSQATLGAIFNAMQVVPGSTNGGRAGTFTPATTVGNYGWVAVLASASTNGVTFFDGLGNGGWSSAGLVGPNPNSPFPDPSVSTVTYTDANGTVWRMFRQDYANASPSGNFTMS